MEKHKRPVDSAHARFLKSATTMQGAMSIMVHLCKIHSLPHLTSIYWAPPPAMFLDVYGGQIGRPRSGDRISRALAWYHSDIVIGIKGLMQ